MKLFTIAFTSSPADSEIWENTRLSLMLQACRSIAVLLFVLLNCQVSYRECETESHSEAFSAASVSNCCRLNSRDFLRDLNSWFKISTRENLASKLDNRLWIDSRMSVKSVPGSLLGDFSMCTSPCRLVMWWCYGLCSGMWRPSFLVLWD